MKLLSQNFKHTSQTEPEIPCSYLKSLSSIRMESAVSDRPLYKSYFMGLDKIGLDNEGADIDDWDNGWDSDSDDVFEVPDRTQSAPSPVREWKKRRLLRPKTCSHLLGR